MFQDIDMEETFSLKSTGALLGYDIKRDNSVGGVDNKQINCALFPAKYSSSSSEMDS